MKEELLKLINLQAIDSEIAGFDYAITNHRNTVANREQSIADKQEAIAALQGRIELLNQKQRETKAEHEDAGARVKDRQNKMMQVQTSREHQALLKEIEENKRLAKETEERLLQFIEQIEQLEAEKKDISEQMRDIYAESKARGYDQKALKTIVSLRKKDKNEVAEQEAILEVYKAALGMA